jgi:hypothetical protein
MNKKAVYIAGSIANCKGYKTKFRAAEKELKRRGFIVLNPAKLPQGLRPEAYMPICLAMVEAADILCLIGDDWHKSRGAMTELRFAEYQNKQVITLNPTEDQKHGL